MCFLCVCVLQVAEMHGELIEFNERLYRSLMAKDHLIVQMRQELIDLRGPVSDWTHTQTHTHIAVHSHLEFAAGFLSSSFLSSLSPCHYVLLIVILFDFHLHFPLFVFTLVLCSLFYTVESCQ